jgi:hypothetical protein
MGADIMSFAADFYTAPTMPVQWKQRQKRQTRRNLGALPTYQQEFKVLDIERQAFLDAVIIVNDAVEHAIRQIDEIERHIDLGSGIRSRMLSALRAALGESSVFPTLTTDGHDGLIAQWKAGPRYLMLEISSDDGYSMMATGNDGELELNVADDGNPDFEGLKILVRDFSSYVESRNPAWREQYV